MGLIEIKERLEAAHIALADHYAAIRTALVESMDTDTISVRDEAWRAAQHVLRTALIADNAARHVETKRRRIELESSLHLPDPFELDPFASVDKNAPAASTAGGVVIGDQTNTQPIPNVTTGQG